jgi:hypothetical protein
MFSTFFLSFNEIFKKMNYTLLAQAKNPRVPSFAVVFLTSRPASKCRFLCQGYIIFDFRLTGGNLELYFFFLIGIFEPWSLPSSIVVVELQDPFGRRHSDSLCCLLLSCPCLSFDWRGLLTTRHSYTGPFKYPQPTFQRVGPQ